MKNMLCERCGSTNIVADRALAGRMVCSRCGSSSIKSSSKYLPKELNKLLIYNKINIFFIIMLLVLFIIIIF